MSPRHFVRHHAPLLLITAIGLTVYLVATRVFTYNIRNNDIVAHLFQAQVFAMGKLYVPSHPVREAFDTWMVVNDGKMYSKYDPGHSAVLALGLVLFGSFKRTLAVLAILNAFILYRIALALWKDWTIALITLIILLISPFFIIASATELPHTSLLLFHGLFVLAFLRILGRDRTRDGLLAGLALGAAFNTRMLEALTFAVPWVAVLAWRAMGFAPLKQPPFVRPLATRRRLGAFLGFLLGFGLLVAVSLAYNRALTGDPFTLPRTRWDPGDRPLLWLLSSLPTLLDRYYNKHLFVMWFLADHVFPLAMGFQVLVALSMLIARDRGSWLLIATLLFTPLPLLSYWHYGDYWNTTEIGPRYLFSLLIPFALLGAKLVAEVGRRLGRGERGGRWPVVAALVCLAVDSTLRADLAHWLEREYGTTRARAALRAQVLPPPGRRGLVFVQGWALGEPDGMFWNHPSLRGAVLFARDRGLKANLELQRTYFPDRSIYVGRIRVAPESFVPAWDLLGPFYAPFPGSLDQSFIDEAHPDSPLSPRSGHEWVLDRPDPVPVVDFATLYAGQRLDNAVAYARATIHASESTAVVLRYGSDDGIAIWLNGERLVREPVERGADIDQGRVPGRLRPGPNLLLVKVNQSWNPWQFALRITDEAGDLPRGVTFSTVLSDRGRTGQEGAERWRTSREQVTVHLEVEGGIRPSKSRVESGHHTSDYP